MCFGGWVRKTNSGLGSKLPSSETKGRVYAPDGGCFSAREPASRRTLRASILWQQVFGIAIVLLLLGCLTAGGEDLEWEEVKSRIRRSFPTVSQLSTIELAEWLATDADSRPLLLDARTPEEYAVSHLAGAFLTPSLEEAVRKVDSVEEGRPIVVYCSVGYRSSQLAEGLAAKGYPNIYNLEGSIFQWANEGRDLYRGNEKVESVHPFDEQWGQLLRRDLWLRSAD